MDLNDLKRPAIKHLYTSTKKLSRLPRQAMIKTQFPVRSAPTPKGVTSLPTNLRANYDTAWARKLPARAARRAALETVGRGLATYYADPKIYNVDRLTDTIRNEINVYIDQPGQFAMHWIETGRIEGQQVSAKVRVFATSDVADAANTSILAMNYKHELVTFVRIHRINEEFYRVMLTLESRDPGYVQDALDELLAKLPEAAIHKVE